jgi:iron complex outermembrane receptor protein
MLSLARAGRVLALAAIVVLPAGARAQQADTMVVPLQEVVVTGTRVPESGLRVPAAVSATDRRDYEAGRGMNLADALTRMPGVLVQNRSGGQDVRITIRGFGARGAGERSNSGTTRGIRVLSDGLPLTEPDGRTSLDLAELSFADRVEVSRSNASALYGNASGGVVQLRTNLSFERPWFDVRSRAGSFGMHREQGQVGFTLGAGRGTFSLLNSTFDGWREHSSNSATLAQGRFSAPLDAHTKVGVVLEAVTNLQRFPGALTRAEMDSLPEMADTLFVQRDERRNNRIARLGLTLDRETASRSVALTAFVEPKALQRSERNRFRDFGRYHIGGSFTWQQRASLRPGVDGSVTVGVDDQYQDGSVLFYNLEPDGSRGTELRANQREGANSGGGFVQGELHWSRWSVRVGARYDDLYYISEDHMDPSLDATDHYGRWTPKGSIAMLLDRHTLYASVGGGVEAPAFNEIDPPPPYDTLTSLNPFLDPMHSVSYEVGAKGSLVRDSRMGRLGYDAALYWIEVANDIVPFDGGAFYETAGETRRRGVELGLTWQPRSPIEVDAGMTYSKNTYETYVSDRGDFSGNDVAGLPQFTGDGAVRVRLAPGLRVEGSVKHVGEYHPDDMNSETVDAFTLLGAMVTFERATPLGMLRAFVSGENLTDENYVSSVFINGVDGRYFEPGLPRNWAFGLSFRLP